MAPTQQDELIIDYRDQEYFFSEPFRSHHGNPTCSHPWQQATSRRYDCHYEPHMVQYSSRRTHTDAVGRLVTLCTPAVTTKLHCWG